MDSRLKYSTIAIIANGNKGPHRDLNNAEGLSFLTCLTTQEGGDLWIHNDKGGDSAVQHHDKTLWGNIVQIQHQPILFPSRALIHSCTPWKGSTRVVLIAFNSLHARSLSRPQIHAEPRLEGPSAVPGGLGQVA